MHSLEAKNLFVLPAQDWASCVYRKSTLLLLGTTYYENCYYDQW